MANILIAKRNQMTKWHGGKGSKRRPEEGGQYEANWEKIFGKRNLKQETPSEIMHAVETFGTPPSALLPPDHPEWIEYYEQQGKDHESE